MTSPAEQTEPSPKPQPSDRDIYVIARLHRFNIGTITADRSVTVRFVRGAVIGHVEEAFIGRLKAGDVFFFAGRQLEFVRLREMTAQVKATTKKSTTVPAWAGGQKALSDLLSQHLRQEVDRCAQGVIDTPELQALKPLLQRQADLSCLPRADQLLLEVGTSDPAVLAQVRQAAPERVLMLRSIWSEEERLDGLLEAGLNQAADGLLLPLPQNLLVEDDLSEQAAALKGLINRRRQRWLENQPADANTSCDVWLAAPAEPSGHQDPMADLILDLFDIGCLLFGEYVQASGAVFNYYIDLRQIISDPNLFHRVLHGYSGLLEQLQFDRIAGIPYGSLPTATGLSLALHKPLIYPRKEVKAHGARRLIEGDFNEGDQVVVVDDILITGGSVLEGIAKLESSGLVVRDVVVFIDHGGDHDRHAKERLSEAGYRCHAVLSIDQITNVLHRAGRLNDAQAATLNAS